MLSATIVHSFYSAFPARKVPVLFFEGHGQERLTNAEVDLSRAVRSFTTLHPLEISRKTTDTDSDSVNFTKGSRHRVAGRGRPYFACRYHHARACKEFQEHATIELLSNYTGKIQQSEIQTSLFQSMDVFKSFKASNVSLTAQPLALIQVTASVEGGALIVSSGLNHETQ